MTSTCRASTRSASTPAAAGDSPISDDAPPELAQVLKECRTFRRCSAPPAVIRAIVLVGGTCAGKSTLAHAAASDTAVAGRCEVVPRWSTRPSRRGDAEDGLTTVSWEAFRSAVDTGFFELSWERPMPDGSAIGYGCAAPRAGLLPLLLAGHGLYTNRTSVRPATALDDALIVGVYAPSEVRARRLSIRSPDVVTRGKADVASLLRHDDELMAANCHLVVDNYGDHENAAVTDFARVVAAVARRGPHA